MLGYDHLHNDFAASSNNWEVLLPLRRLRRLTLLERDAHERLVLRTLGKMPWVPHVHYWGATSGEHGHRTTAAWRCHPWLHQLGHGPVQFAESDYGELNGDYFSDEVSAKSMRRPVGPQRQSHCVIVVPVGLIAWRTFPHQCGNSVSDRSRHCCRVSSMQSSSACVPDTA